MVSKLEILDIDIGNRQYAIRLSFMQYAYLICIMHIKYLNIGYDICDIYQYQKIIKTFMLKA